MSYALAVGALVSCAAVAGAFYTGFRAGADSEATRHAEAEMLIERAGDAAAERAAKAIAGIKLQHTTIRQEVEREVREKTVYRDCSHSPDGLLRLNSALQGAGKQAPGPGELPKADAPGR